MQTNKQKFPVHHHSMLFIMYYEVTGKALFKMQHSLLYASLLFPNKANSFLTFLYIH